ncbi:MAG: peptidyl-prolyl cis-trans isomerase A (cyclophilin A) [Planctomycetota bacterium]|jgi:peptidyl-prolyl cis-trans isomerase A (cyclophilin A)
MIRVHQRPALMVLTLLLLMCCASCRDSLDLHSDQAVLIVERAREHPVLFKTERDLERAPDVFQVKFRIETGGNFIIEAHREWAPNSVDRFYNLSKADFWKRAPIIRVVPGHVIQWGIHPSPGVTKSWREHSFDPDRILKSNRRGYVVFAPDLDSRRPSTQIMVNLSDHLTYDKFYAPFGRVIKGLDALERVYGDYGDLVEYGNKIGPDAKLAVKRGQAYIEHRFPLMNVFRSTTLSEKTP